VHLQGNKIDTIKKNTETLTDVRKEVGLNIDIKKNNVRVAVSSVECRQKQSLHKNSKQVVSKCVTVRIFGKDSNKSKL
jgi:hypothetical protein